MRSKLERFAHTYGKGMSRGVDALGEETDDMLRERMTRALADPKYKGQRAPLHEPRQGPAQLTGHGLFLYELDLLCQKHCVSLEHEDGHGSGLLVDCGPGEGSCGIAFCYEEYSQ